MFASLPLPRAGEERGRDSASKRADREDWGRRTGEGSSRLRFLSWTIDISRMSFSKTVSGSAALITTPGHKCLNLKLAILSPPKRRIMQLEPFRSAIVFYFTWKHFQKEGASCISHLCHGVDRTAGTWWCGSTMALSRRSDATWSRHRHSLRKSQPSTLTPLNPEPSTK